MAPSSGSSGGATGGPSGAASSEAASAAGGFFGSLRSPDFSQLGGNSSQLEALVIGVVVGSRPDLDPTWKCFLAQNDEQPDHWKIIQDNPVLRCTTFKASP